MNLFIPFAIDSHGVLVTANQVERGLKCNCLCPGCGEHLIAKQGTKNVAHFAHSSGGECAAGYESSIHLAIKNIIQKSKSLSLPECNFYTYRGQKDDVHEHYGKSDPRMQYKSDEDFEIKHEHLLSIAHIPSRIISFDSVDLEVDYQDVRPDIICSVGEKKLFIEVAFTHFVDEEKLNKLRRIGISTLEIDVSEFRHSAQSLDVLENIILGNGSQKKWLLNVHATTLAAKDAVLRASRLETRNRAKYEKDLQIQAKFGAIYEATFLYGRQQKIVVKLSKKNISVTIKPQYIDSPPKFRLYDLMLAHNGNFIEKYRKWELVSSSALFFTLAQSFNTDCKFIQWICPPDELDEFFKKIKLAPVQLEDKTDDPIVVTSNVEIQIENNSNLSPAMRALAAARKASDQVLSNRSLSQQQSPNEDPKDVILYYSTKEDFLSLSSNTEKAWEDFQLVQRARNSRTFNGWYYVDFNPTSYFAWLGDLKDSKRLRENWAATDVENGWLIP